jgi:hypothetical protein
VAKNIIRVSTWLRTNTIPDRLSLYNASALVTTGGAAKTVSFKELNIAVSQIQALHLIPPAHDPPDFDPTEPNRKMEPVYALVNSFMIKGSLRLSANTSLKKFLEVTHESYTSLYDAEITSLINPAFRGITVPFLMVRQDSTVFTTR